MARARTGALAISNADKIRNAATMFGSGSRSHKAAIARFGASTSGRRRESGGGSGQDCDRKGRFT